MSAVVSDVERMAAEMMGFNEQGNGRKAYFTRAIFCTNGNCEKMQVWFLLVRCVVCGVLCAVTPNVGCVQSGAYYSAVGPDSIMQLRMLNYPQPGDTEELYGILLGGVAFTIVDDNQGLQKLTNLRNLLVQDPAKPKSISCEAGTIILMPNNKMFCKHGVVWGLMQGPSEESMVPQFPRPQPMKPGPSKKLPNASKEVILDLPGDEVAQAFTGRYLGYDIMKICEQLIEVAADGKTIVSNEKGQNNLRKVLNVEGVELWLEVDRKIPEMKKSVSLKIFAQHKNINGGKKIMLFASAMAGHNHHILQKGVLPGNLCLKDLMTLPLSFPLRDMIEKLVKPLVDFAVHLETYVTAKKYEKNHVTETIPGNIRGLIMNLGKLYKSQDKEKVDRLLKSVKTRVGKGDDGEWCSSGLLMNLVASEDEEEEDEEELYGEEPDNTRKRKAVASHNSNASTPKSGRGSRSQSSSRRGSRSQSSSRRSVGSKADDDEASEESGFESDH